MHSIPIRNRNVFEKLMFRGLGSARSFIFWMIFNSWCPAKAPSRQVNSKMQSRK